MDNDICERIALLMKGHPASVYAQILGVTEEEVEAFKRDRQPSPEQLQSIAVVSGACVADIKYQNPIREEDGSIAVTELCHFHREVDYIQGFWGHFGFETAQQGWLWYPLSQDAATQLEEAFQHVRSPEDLVVVATLNNRVLVLRAGALRRFRFLDEAEDRPVPFVTKPDSVCGYSLELDNILAESEFSESGIEALMAHRFVKDAARERLRELEEHHLEAEVVATHTVITLQDGSMFSYPVDQEELLDFWSDANLAAAGGLGEAMPGVVRFTDRQTDAAYQYLTGSIAWVDMPLRDIIQGSAYEEARRKQ